MSFLSPSNALLTEMGKDGNATVFVLASPDWLGLQAKLAAIGNLPSNYDDFGTRYGDPASGLEMKDCFSAMKDLETVVSRCGGAASVRRRLVSDPDFLGAARPPVGDDFGATLWVMNRARHDAKRMASALKALSELSQGRPAPEIVNAIKDTFCATDQILDSMQVTADRVDALVAAFSSRASDLRTAQTAMERFTDVSSKTRKALDKELPDIAAKIEHLGHQRDDAYNKWLDFTIAAAIVSTGIAIIGTTFTAALTAITAIPPLTPLSGGIAVFGGGMTAAAATAAAAGFGVAASNARDTYNDLLTEITTETDLQQKRSAYAHDLAGLDAAMRFVLPDCTNVVEQLTVVREAWRTTIGQTRDLVAGLDPSSLQDSDWTRKDAMTSSSAGWDHIDQGVYAFMTGALIDPHVVKFGERQDAPEPGFEAKLAERLTKRQAA
jgi:hypothetical protein